MKVSGGICPARMYVDPDGDGTDLGVDAHEGEAVRDRMGMHMKTMCMHCRVMFVPDDAGENEPHWVGQLRKWKETGTFARLAEAGEAGTPVNVPRSDGTVTTGVIIGTSAFAGRAVSVKFQVDGEDRYKVVPTDDFLELNPEFGPSLKEMKGEEQ